MEMVPPKETQWVKQSHLDHLLETVDKFEWEKGA
jgi:hypothetical protein